jgi:hypothetical protein
MKSSLFVEFSGRQTDDKALLKSAKDVWTGSGKAVKDLKSVELYLKPAESKCYYVFNESDKGSFDV